MKYELPDGLKRYKFFCSDALTGVTYNTCKYHCHSDFRHLLGSTFEKGFKTRLPSR